MNPKDLPRAAQLRETDMKSNWALAIEDVWIAEAGAQGAYKGSLEALAETVQIKNAAAIHIDAASQSLIHESQELQALNVGVRDDLAAVVSVFMSTVDGLAAAATAVRGMEDYLVGEEGLVGKVESGLTKRTDAIVEKVERNLDDAGSSFVKKAQVAVGQLNSSVSGAADDIEAIRRSIATIKVQFAINIMMLCVGVVLGGCVVKLFA